MILYETLKATEMEGITSNTFVVIAAIHCISFVALVTISLIAWGTTVREVI